MQHDDPTADRCLWLGTYDEDGEETLLLADLLADPEAPAGLADDDSVVVLRVAGRDLLREVWNFGALDVIARQLEGVGARLAAGQTALLRSAVMGQAKVPYVRWRPDGAGETEVTVFFVTAPELRFAFPDGAQGAALEAHVTDSWDTLERRPVATVATARLLADLPVALAEAHRYLAR